ncbi:MAG: histidine triad nucleotide-binding protein [Aeromicrobium sp.]|mgnify:CR=1 FL=1|uniref:histidine triad nucleotide-binding protein n=1 Tax=Aeromicrobium sp. TaxID=1871063 RepID=UPI0025C3DA1E|nr:histidine triad nucleotide-binding protein [Aeromicrobium sp.]MCK5892472.1 histidine triad nucleotide-binding protein [Aeromicrobium sp.]MDF1704023.1 histidine triad nucleotide-binding protein [Aeromicrobium sp.]
MSDDCLFCSIVAGDVPADVVGETDHTLAFRDINPQAPTHVLVIPKRHEPDVASLAAADPEATVDLITHTRRIADELGTGSYRLVFNTGADAFQTVFHCHGHVLSGRSLTWPPG